MVKACQVLNIPVLVSEQVPSKLGYTHSYICLPFEKYEKTTFSMFGCESGRRLLEKAYPEVVIIVGIETHVCVLQTCLDILENGVQIHVVTDAVSSQRAQDHEIALRRLERCGAFLTTSESLIFQMVQDSTHKDFRTLSKLCVERAKRDCASNEEKKNDAVIRLNTSNEFKFNEFKRLFTKFGNLKLERTKVDLDEIDVRVSFIKTLSLSFCILTHSLPQARPALVVAQKATSAGVNVLIEDTSLDVEGAEVGVNIRWIMDNLKDLIGRRAVWRVMLGILRSDQKVYIYEGITNGVIVKARGDSAFGFDPVFLPEGSTKTLAEDKPDSVSARCKAVEAMMNDDAVSIHCPIKKEDWKGKWQH